MKLAKAATANISRAHRALRRELKLKFNGDRAGYFEFVGSHSETSLELRLGASEVSSGSST